MTDEQRRSLFSTIDRLPPLKSGDHEYVRHLLYRVAMKGGEPLDAEASAFVDMLLREFCPGYGDCDVEV